MAVVFALLSALSNAVSVATQHVASTADPRRSSGWRLVVYLFRNPLWLFGWVALVGGLLFQALALHGGLVSVVQPLLGHRARLRARAAPVLDSPVHPPDHLGRRRRDLQGLAVFIVAGEPQGGHPTPTSDHWAVAAVTCGVGAAVLALLAQRASPGWRAGLYACAAATIWALEATIIKATTDTLTEFGVAGTLTRWPVYALVVGGVVGTFLQQVALDVGPLRVSQLFLVIVDPIISIALSVWLFGERFKPDVGPLAVAAIAFAAMCVGVVFLTQTALATMKADAGE